MRNVTKCREMAEKRDDIIRRLRQAMVPDVLAEDVFFGYCGWDKEIAFTVPSPRLAARFSVQTDYARGMRDIRKKGMSFGCHYWWRSNYDFWKPHIEKFGYVLPSMETSSSLKGDALRRIMYLAKRYAGKESTNLINFKSYSVYGGGVWGRKCVGFLKQLSLEVRRVYDRSMAESDIYGVPVEKPNKEEMLERKSFIVIATLKYEKEIRRILLEIGLKDGDDCCSLYDFCCRSVERRSKYVEKIIAKFPKCCKDATENEKL